jgi:farnesyl-diphosphate farnesyltransferase
MNSHPNDEIYQAQILTRVSRTFALTIPQLPPALSNVVSNGYLLCRIADTIEDESYLTPQVKKYFTHEFIKVITGESDAQIFSKNLHSQLSSSTSNSEKELILNTPRITRLTHSFSPQQQQTLYHCVRIMAKGMAEYQQRSSLAGLKDLTELDQYCYYVAGVVGEMLTQLFCHYSPQIAEKHHQLQTLATSFGQALQMTNILKDNWEDRQRGACWLPQEIFTHRGIDLTTITPQNQPTAYSDGIAELISITRVHLHNALRYILLIPATQTGIRRFCIEALIFAILTLRKINQTPKYTQGQQVKITRRSVKATIITTYLTAHSNHSLSLLYNILTRPLPPEQPVIQTNNKPKPQIHI